MFSNSNTCYGICTESPKLSCTGNTKQKSVSYTKHFNTSAPKIEPVPDRISLAKNRFYIKLLDGWAVPIQLTRSEGSRLLPLLEGVRDRSQALDIIERVLPPTIGGAS